MAQARRARKKEFRKCAFTPLSIAERSTAEFFDANHKPDSPQTLDPRLQRLQQPFSASCWGAVPLFSPFASQTELSLKRPRSLCRLPDRPRRGDLGVYVLSGGLNGAQAASDGGNQCKGLRRTVRLALFKVALDLAHLVGDMGEAHHIPPPRGGKGI